MFKRKTLFIVGAGASNEVGFPTGPELAMTISDNLKLTKNDSGPPDFHDHELHSEIRRSLAQQDQRQQLANYMAAAKRIREGVTLRFSIDDFLSRDPYIVQVGKASIVRAILAAERRSNLYVDQSNIYNQMNFRNIGTT